MKWPKWSIATHDSNDFLPILIGGLLLVFSLPTFVLLLCYPEPNAGVLMGGLLVACGTGIALGSGFLIFGIRTTSFPGSLAYRLSRGRIFFK